MSDLTIGNIHIQAKGGCASINYCKNDVTIINSNKNVADDFDNMISPLKIIVSDNFQFMSV
jgi:hypothetical protein